MATWFRIEFEGEPTEADFARVSELAAHGFTSGQLISERTSEDCGLPGCTGFSCPYCERCTAECPNMRCAREVPF